jgi:hypothetical protein
VNANAGWKTRAPLGPSGTSFFQVLASLRADADNLRQPRHSRQHFNFIELNFLFPEVKETRNRDRFIKVAEHAREFTPDKPAVREFIKFLKDHHTVLDPTMNLFEGLFCGDPSAVTPGLEEIVPRFPAQIRRSMRSGALEVPAEKAAAYREAFPAMLRLLKAVSDADVTIIPEPTPSPVTACITSSNFMCAPASPPLKSCAWPR